MTRAIYRAPWRVDLTVRDGVVAPTSATDLVRMVTAGLDAAGAPSPASIGLILSDDAELTELNGVHMGKDGPTDVLSFPLLSPDAFPPHDGSALPDGADAFPAFPVPPGHRQHLGDIVISVERAVDQAEAGRGGQTGDVHWSAADEVRLLAVHGTLHICGWDHAEPEEEAAMRAVEAWLLSPGSSSRRGSSTSGRTASD